MDELFKNEERKRGMHPVLIGGMAVGVILVGLAVYVFFYGFYRFASKPTIDQQTAQILAGAAREGSPEFAEVNKDIIIWTDDETVESPTGLGTISMYIKGNVKNKGTRTISVLEVNVGVITQQNQVLREKRVVVVPIQQSVLGPGDVIPITLTLDGFDRKDDRANIRWKVTAIKAQ
jgi:hypothetical protein